LHRRERDQTPGDLSSDAVPRPQGKEQAMKRINCEGPVGR
jgi:hypothetical protein